ncbi:hypothetical protein F4813DRAFT_37101 [Daldinia decipiens]|uniref:uncharacterized protein n=1 Tax=Daldinia decipiens TaxID=326647 RepID=UPI0020C301F9|nr:uncharacterized protein F4813DRAFT_37101 [Daldinia decipiens]KAI1659035.1 hypothetical protein F4813DRAFT_37101 [Daldinia decipiens]
MASSPSQPQSAAPPQPTPTPTPQPPINPFVHNVALGVTPIALFALFLPPRRLDLRAMILGGVALWGTDRLVADYSGTSSLRRMARRLEQMSGAELPDKAKETQARLRAERARRAQDGVAEDQRRSMMLEEHRREKEKEKEKGLLQRVWMGDSGEDWKAKRDQREKEALSEGGGGYWSLIADQVSEVWNQGGKKKNDGDEEKEEKESESKKP